MRWSVAQGVGGQRRWSGSQGKGFGRKAKAEVFWESAEIGQNLGQIIGILGMQNSNCLVLWEGKKTRCLHVMPKANK